MYSFTPSRVYFILNYLHLTKKEKKEIACLFQHNGLRFSVLFKCQHIYLFFSLVDSDWSKDKNSIGYSNIEIIICLVTSMGNKLHSVVGN